MVKFIKNWMDRDYEKMGFGEGEPAYDTDVGARVRSKSEALISNILERHEVPQLYEVPLELKGYGKVRPDFLVLNVRTRQEYVWEHLGMLDDLAYLEKAMKKIEAYIANGYIPGINLIITFESSKHPLDLKTVDKLIETFLKYPEHAPHKQIKNAVPWDGVLFLFICGRRSDIFSPASGAGRVPGIRPPPWSR